MTPANPQPPAVPSDADADARFAAYLDDIAAHVDDPESGEFCREVLNDDPEEQRALFDLCEALAANPAPFDPSALFMAAVGAIIILIVVLVVL